MAAAEYTAHAALSQCREQSADCRAARDSAIATYEPKKDPKKVPKKARATFTHRFTRSVELTGETKLKIWVSTSEGDDIDLFVVLRKFTARGKRGKEVFFCGYNGYEKDAVAKGCRVPESGKIHIVQNGLVRAKEIVLAEWQKTLFLRSESLKPAAGCLMS